MSGYSIMTVNMNGHTNAPERRKLLSEIIRREGKQSSLVFCQELPGRFERDVVPDNYDFVRTTEKHAAVMWSKQHFHSKKVDAGFKTKIFNRLPDAMKKIDDDITEIPGRTAVARLTAIEESCDFLAASWHGPHSGETLEKKRKALKGLILFLLEVCRRMKDVSSIIIGGDFNLNTLDKNGLDELNVYFPSYELSPRGKLATEREGQGRPYIPYKDNFAITTTSPNVVSPFGVKNLSEVKPLLEFVYVKQEGSEEKDILDHDPIIGFLQLGKTLSIEASEVAVNKGQREVDDLAQSLEKQLSLTSTDTEDEDEEDEVEGDEDGDGDGGEEEDEDEEE